ncbi:transcription termination/antitermination protein NusG [Granulicella arctica]|uniref:transcription termination/antitermination protein NusG n=1 Tax=Granulicella arctica TaxID=940613 RepID=UPI0021E0DD64|nr:UpxY family transcription antiterminator [Granulicella arctica]
MVRQVATTSEISPPYFCEVRGWYAVYTYPKHEARVAKELSSREITNFLPTFVTTSRWKDRTVQLATPLFPGYVFAQIEPAERSKILMTNGVVRILSYNGKPALIPDSEIDAIKLCLRTGSARSVVGPIAVGERVRVRSGPLAGLEGFISRSKTSRLLLVPISLLHQSVSIEVDAELIEILPPLLKVGQG